MLSQRIEKIMASLENNSAALIESEPNVFYLTGMLSSEGKVLITKDKAYFLVDFRYIESAKNIAKHLEVFLADNFIQNVSELLKKHGVKTLFTEINSIPYSRFLTFKNSFSGVYINDDNTLDNLLTSLRQIKSEAELNLIKKAQELTDETFSYICERIAIGKTEIEIMLDMEFFIRKLGSKGVSFDFIVASGKNSSMPHAVPTDKKIQKGDFITMDFGAVSGGYRSDMTRTVAVGNISDEQQNVYDTVLNAQLSALSAIKPGKKCNDIDKTARDIIDNAGYKGMFGHALGHSVGIEIHETPNFSPRCDSILKPGNIMTVEPGIYIENKFGVRIEDMVYITESGYENLTKSNKNLIVL